MNLKDCLGVVHSPNPIYYQYTLCGVAYDAPIGSEYDTCTDDIMTETEEDIDCPDCIQIIKYCKTIKIKK